MEEWTAEKLFAGRPGAFRLFGIVRRYIESLGPVKEEAAKTQVSFGVKTKFAWVWLPQLWIKKQPDESITLAFDLDHPVKDPRIKESVEPRPGRWMHHAVIMKEEDFDDKVRSWLQEAYNGQKDRRKGRYVAFLRGINVGGNKILKMDELKKAFESLGFKDVKTILASGNVIFEGGGRQLTKIEDGLGRRFGFRIPVIARSFAELEAIAASDPFKGVKPGTRLFVTFLAEKPKRKAEDPRILRATGSEIFAALGPDEKTTDYMAFLDKEFGKNTTRNWNSIEKILKG